METWALAGAYPREIGRSTAPGQGASPLLTHTSLPPQVLLTAGKIAQCF
jgi:hypothetical protein